MVPQGGNKTDDGNSVYSAGIKFKDKEILRES